MLANRVRMRSGSRGDLVLFDNGEGFGNWYNGSDLFNATESFELKDKKISSEFGTYNQAFIVTEWMDFTSYSSLAVEFDSSHTSEKTTTVDIPNSVTAGRILIANIAGPPTAYYKRQIMGIISDDNALADLSYWITDDMDCEVAYESAMDEDPYSYTTLEISKVWLA